jgi:excisionase family DNA binding protein
VTDRLLTTREVAAFLGVSPETVLRRWRAGEIPGFRLASNVLRFRESEIETWLEGTRPRRPLAEDRGVRSVMCLGLRTDTQLDHDCKDALGARAGASITVRGRLCAERRPIVATKREKPLDLLGRAIAGTSGDELLEMWLRLMEEVADRLENHATAIEDGAPSEIANEAAVFARRAHDLAPWIAGGSERAKRIRRDIYSSEKYILGLIENGVAVDAS